MLPLTSHTAGKPAITAPHRAFSSTCARLPARHPHRVSRSHKIKRSRARAAADALEPPPPAAAAAAAADADEFLELPEAQHVILQPGFQPELVAELRAHVDARLGSPLQAAPERFCFDWWHVPDQYTLLRTPADRFFPPALHDRLVDALAEYGERVLGCRGLSPLWLSVYVAGCHQGWHADAPHGPFAFVLSLTHWEGRRFTGGETMLLQPHVLDYWRAFDPQLGTETPQLVTHIPALFDQLVSFDGRVPHGVRQVEGTRDPLEGRIVLHGWFTQPSPFFTGALSEEEATPALNACLDGLYTALAELPPCVGTVTLRLDVDAHGRVADLRWLASTLVGRPHASGEPPEEAAAASLACIAEHLLAARFPSSASASGGATSITLPFVFQ